MSEMKKIICTTLLLLIVLLSVGFATKKGSILFNDVPINQVSQGSEKLTFNVGDKIHYFIYMPKGFKDDYIRIQVIKGEDKVTSGGYKVVFAQDVELSNLNKNSYSDYFVIYEKGVYIMQVLEFKNMNKGVAYGTFGVKEQ